MNKQVWIVFEDDLYGCACSNANYVRGVYTTEKAAKKKKAELDKHHKNTYHTSIDEFELEESDE